MVNDLIDQKDTSMKHVQQFAKHRRHFVIGQFVGLTNGGDGVFDYHITRSKMLL